MAPRSALRWVLTAPCALPLAHASAAQLGTVKTEQKISATEGGFEGTLGSTDLFGRASAGLGDLDGDGTLDLAVGAILQDDGAVWILFLNADGTVESEQKIGEGVGGFGGDLTADFFGCCLACLGDLDGDGVQDLAVGSYGDDDGGSNQGALWILFLDSDGTVKSWQKISEAAGGLGNVLDPGDSFGWSAAALGDLDGDGAPELAVGALNDDDGGQDQGAVWILSLGPNGTVASKRKISATTGGFGGTLEVGDSFGAALAALGDFDGDGVSELATGIYDDDGGTNQGAVWLLFLNADGTVKAEQEIGEGVGGFGGALSSSDFFGESLAPLGDFDRDGVPDLAVGARTDDEVTGVPAAVWILFLNADGTVRSEQKISESSGGFRGDLDFLDFFGSSSLGLVGDLDGDGFPELAAGADEDDDGAGQAGAVWILFLWDCVRLDFETEDDFETRLVNGQDISTPPEFGNLVAITSSGPNARAAIFNSTPGGPNDPSQDRDLLVGRGKILILQTSDNTTQTVPGIFDRPNDDEDGGMLSFDFVSPVMPMSLDLVDIDGGADEASSVTLTDLLGGRRVFAVPPGWTGDLLAGQPGVLTLDLTTLDVQPGFASDATAFEDPGFRASQVVSLDVHLGSSGALDDLVWCPSDSASARPGPRARLR